MHRFARSRKRKGATRTANAAGDRSRCTVLRDTEKRKLREETNRVALRFAAYSKASPSLAFISNIVLRDKHAHSTI